MRLAVPIFILIVFSTTIAYGYVGKAEIKSTSDEISAIEGEAIFKEVDGGIEMHLTVSNAWKMGTHPLNIYEFGNCQQMGKAAGQPFILPEDNLATVINQLKVEINEKGSGQATMFLPGLTLKDGPKSIIGRSLIINEQDKSPTDATVKETPIGCGPIVITGN